MRLLSYLAVTSFLVACGDDARTSPATAVGAGGTAGVGNAGASGMGNGGAAQGASGTGGANAGGNAVGGSGPGLDDIDPTLGGMNQDLPRPTQDCTALPTPISGCMSWTAEYDGARLDGACPDGVRIGQLYGPAGTVRAAQCDFLVAPADEFGVALGFGPAAIGTPPSIISVSAPPYPDPNSQGGVAFFRDARSLTTGLGGAFELGNTHDFAWRLTAVTAIVPGALTGNRSENAKGYFAATLTPKAGCTPDGSGFGCDSIRMRATFNLRTITVLPR